MIYDFFGNYKYVEIYVYDIVYSFFVLCLKNCSSYFLRKKTNSMNHKQKTGIGMLAYMYLSQKIVSTIFVEIWVWL